MELIKIKKLLSPPDSGGGGEVDTEEPEVQEETRLEITPNPVNLKETQTQVLTIDTDATDVTDSNDHPEFATYTKETKTIKAIAPGTSTITFSATAEGKTEKTVAVVVNVTELPATELNLGKTSTSLAIPLTEDITVQTNATDFTADAENSKVQVTKGQGKITIKALEEGTCNITISATAAESKTTTKKIAVTVNPQEVTQLSLSKESTNIKVPNTEEITVTTNADDYTVSSNNENVTVEKLSGSTKKFRIVAVNAGSSVITVQATKVNCVQATKTLNVNIEAADPEETQLSLSKESTSLTVDDVEDIIVTTDAETFTVESTATDKATAEALVAEKKVRITAKQAGDCNIIVRAQRNGNYTEVTKQIAVTIKEKTLEMTTLIPSKTSVTVKVNSTVEVGITTDAETFEASASGNKIKVTKGEKKIMVEGITPGTDTVNLTATAAGKQQAEASVGVTVNDAGSLEDDDSAREEYLSKAAGMNYIPKQDETNRKFLDSITFANTSQLKLDQTVKVTAWDNIAYGNFTKVYVIKKLIRDMASNKIGQVKFTSVERAKSFIKIIKDLTKEQYGSTLTDTQKVKIIRNICNAHKITIE